MRVVHNINIRRAMSATGRYATRQCTAESWLPSRGYHMFWHGWTTCARVCVLPRAYLNLNRGHQKGINHVLSAHFGIMLAPLVEQGFAHPRNLLCRHFGCPTWLLGRGCRASIWLAILGRAQIIRGSIIYGGLVGVLRGAAPENRTNRTHACMRLCFDGVVAEV